MEPQSENTPDKSMEPQSENTPDKSMEPQSENTPDKSMEPPYANIPVILIVNGEKRPYPREFLKRFPIFRAALYFQPDLDDVIIDVKYPKTYIQLLDAYLANKCPEEFNDALTYMQSIVCDSELGLSNLQLHCDGLSLEKCKFEQVISMANKYPDLFYKDQSYIEFILSSISSRDLKNHKIKLQYLQKYYEENPSPKDVLCPAVMGRNTILTNFFLKNRLYNSVSMRNALIWCIENNNEIFAKILNNYYKNQKDNYSMETRKLVSLAIEKQKNYDLMKFLL